jgi:peptide/nickel transport system ATP-binding protein
MSGPTAAYMESAGTEHSRPPRRLSIESLSISYSMSGRDVEVVRDLSLAVESGQTIGIVGTTGSGKSSVGLAIIGLLPPGARTTGRIMLDDENLLECRESRLRQIRGKSVGMIFQDSLAALNPVLPIRSQLAETIRRHSQSVSRSVARKRAEEALLEVDIPRERLTSYPHQFSGGMRQRAMIAMALLPDPSFLIADEATTDLDAPNQRRTLDLLRDIQGSRGLGLIVVSHDLAVIGHVCEHVAVINKGELVELGTTQEILLDPKDAYTKRLIQLSARSLTPSGRLFTGREDVSPEVSA